MARSGIATMRVRHNRLPALARAFPGAVSASLRRGAFATEAGGKVRAPVDTGALRNSIQTEGATPGSLSMRVTTGVAYAAYQEFGTRRNPPHPFLRPTTAQTFPATIAELKALEKAL